MNDAEPRHLAARSETLVVTREVSFKWTVFGAALTLRLLHALSLVEVISVGQTK